MSEASLIGKPAPTLSLPDENGETYELAPGSKGAPIALFFYPKSGSMGCTMEACSFRDALVEIPSFGSSNVEVVGISGDAVEKQKAFVEKHKLTYTVLSDVNGEARKAYGVGKSIMGLSEGRMTFIIDRNGIVRDMLSTVLNPGAHVKFVTTWLNTLEAEEKATTTTT